MAAVVPLSRPASSNRRARVRHKAHVPAYASFRGSAPNDALDLSEILDINQTGLSLQSAQPLQVNQAVDLSLNLAEAGGKILASARVAWFDPSGRAGFDLAIPEEPAQRRLREWLLLNALAAAANAEPPPAPAEKFSMPALHQDYTETLNAASAVQREAESLGDDLEAVLSLLALRSQSLLRASGAAIALAGKDPGTMICRASSGESAPPVGVILQVGSGFSGECVRTGKFLRCDDTENDTRVDAQSCRALHIRSILAAPIVMGDKTIGLIELFAETPNAFSPSDSAVLQRLADTILAAVTRAMRAHDPEPPPPPPPPFSPSPGSVLFARMPEETSTSEPASGSNNDSVGGVSLPRTHLFLLIAVAATIFLALGFLSAPWIQPWIQHKLQSRPSVGEQTVLASSKPQPDPSRSSESSPTVDTANLWQLRELASGGDSAAQNAMGLLYSVGDDKQGITRDEAEAARWFTKAAEHGSVPAQSKLGSLYWGGRGVVKDDNHAYFWTVLARASGDDASKALAPFIAARLSQPQRVAIEQQAEQWLEQHVSHAQSQPPH
jgi:putative methionine-R-sulfoxide reductase with GAF domain/Tfp pilus assembly protein PilZ